MIRPTHGTIAYRRSQIVVRIFGICSSLVHTQVLIVPPLSPNTVHTVPVSGFGIPYASVVTRAHTVSPLLQYKSSQHGHGLFIPPMFA